MLKKFVTRRPKAQKPAVEPLQSQRQGAPEPPKVEDGAGTRSAAPKPAADKARPKELGGPSGPEPTRYGDWERKGICSDF